MDSRQHMAEMVRKSRPRWTLAFTLDASQAGPGPPGANFAYCLTMTPMTTLSIWLGEGSAACMQPYPSTYHSSAASWMSQPPTCIKYNKQGGDCRFGQGCKYHHVCYPKSKYTKLSGVKNSKVKQWYPLAHSGEVHVTWGSSMCICLISGLKMASAHIYLWLHTGLIAST